MEMVFHGKSLIFRQFFLKNKKDKKKLIFDHVCVVSAGR